MKKIFLLVFTLSLIMTIVFSFAFSAARAQSCEYFIKNDTMLDARHLQFDIYLKAKGEPFYYGMGQFKIEYNEALAKGGNITANINRGVTDLDTLQVPKSILQLKDNSFRINSASTYRKQSKCTLIKNKGLGTRICRVVLENTVNFPKVPANLHFIFNGPGASAVYYMNEKDLLVITK